MNPIDYLKISLSALLANKVRSALTMLGVIIGVFSVITFLAIGEGLKSEIAKQFENFGSNLLIVVPGKVDGFQSFGNTLGASTLSIKDADSIRSNSHVQNLSPLMLVSAVVAYDGKTVSGPMVVGTDENASLVQNMEFEAGGFFTNAQVAQKARVAVLGGNAKQKIFGLEFAIGKSLAMFSQQFVVVGSLKTPEGQFSLSGGGPEDFIYIPFSTAQELTRSEQIARIMVKVKTQEELALAQKEIERIILANHGTDDFTVLQQGQIVDLFDDLFGQLTTAISGIGAISLLVGGIGIMNIMFVSVTERTREIGLRKAVGATNVNILIQFLSEAATLSFSGGAIGVFAAFGLTEVLKSTVSLPSHITWQAVVLAFGVSLAIGLIFGIVPAFRAARKNPIEALRYE